MAKNNSEPKNNDNTIARNERASFEYHLEERFEAGLELQGWEVKSLRAGKANISDSTSLQSCVQKALQLKQD